MKREQYVVCHSIEHLDGDYFKAATERAPNLLVARAMVVRLKQEGHYAVVQRLSDGACLAAGDVWIDREGNALAR